MRIALSWISVPLGLVLLAAPSARAQEGKEKKPSTADLEKRIAALEADRAALLKRVEKLEAAKALADLRRDLETRLAAVEKGAASINTAVKAVRDGNAALKSRLEEVDKARRQMAAPVKALQEGQAALQTRVASLDGNQKKMDNPIKSLEARVAALDAGQKKLDVPVRALQKRQDGLVKRIDTLAPAVDALELARKGIVKKLVEADAVRQSTLRLVNELDAARPKVQKQIKDLGAADRAADKTLQSLRLRIAELADQQQQSADKSAADLDAVAKRLAAQLATLRRQDTRLTEGLADAARLSESERENGRVLRLRLRETKLALLKTFYRCADGDLPGDTFYPFEKHFPYIGIEFKYLSPERSREAGVEKGPALKILRLAHGGPAREAGLDVGDILLSVDGTPVKPSNLPGFRFEEGRPWARALKPNYVTTHLPGDEVEVEYLRAGARKKALLRFGCASCEEACSFANP